MTMSNNEKDKAIKEALQKDKFTATNQDNMKKEIKDEFVLSKIKPKKHTYFQRTVIKLLVLVLIISVALNIYFIKFNKKRKFTSKLRFAFKN